MRSGWCEETGEGARKPPQRPENKNKKRPRPPRCRHTTSLPVVSLRCRAAWPGLLSVQVTPSVPTLRRRHGALGGPCHRPCGAGSVTTLEPLSGHVRLSWTPVPGPSSGYFHAARIVRSMARPGRGAGPVMCWLWPSHFNPNSCACAPACAWLHKVPLARGPATRWGTGRAALRGAPPSGTREGPAVLPPKHGTGSLTSLRPDVAVACVFPAGVAPGLLPPSQAHRARYHRPITAQEESA